MKPLLITSALALSFLATPILTAQAASHDRPSDVLADCLYRHANTNDKQVFEQWAFVTLGKTSAAKKVETIPQAKITDVETKAQKTLTHLVVGKCSAPAMKVLWNDPKNGLQDTLTSLARQLVDAEMKKRSSPLLALTITDLLKK